MRYLADSLLQSLCSLVVFALAGAATSAGLTAQSTPNNTAPTPNNTPNGRALFLQYGCVHCHREDKPSGLTEQSLAGPDLRRAGKRLDVAWMSAWLRGPPSHEPAPEDRPAAPG